MNTFWKKGFAPTSVSDLASAMSITRSSFYNSFESRELVFEEALARYRSDEVNLTLFQEQDHLSATDCLYMFFRDVCAKLAADPEARGCLIINCYVQAYDTSPPPAGVQRFVDTKIDQFRDIIEQAISDGVLAPATKPDETAHAMMAFLIGLNVLGRSIRDESALWASVETYLQCLGFRPDT